MDRIDLPRFLSAEWRDLLLLTYFVPPKVLVPYLPRGLEPDLFDGAAAVSLVAFRFLGTRFAGIRPPLFHSFAELNLRCYARHPESGMRGVVFIREICPYTPVGLTARIFFNERFVIRRCEFEAAPGRIQYRFANGLLSAKIGGTGAPPNPGTFEHFITDRYHGYSAFHGSTTLHFEAGHTPWNIRSAELESAEFPVRDLCGGELARILEGPPVSVLYSEGSPIELSWGELIHDRLPLWSRIWPAQSHG